MLLGKYRIRIYEKDFLRVANILKSRKIAIMNNRIKKQYIFLEIEYYDFNTIRQIFKKKNIKYKVVNTKGIYFILEYLAKNWLFTLTFAVSLLTIFLSTCFIWNVKIDGEKHIKEEDIMTFLNEYGIESGRWKIGIDTEKINNALRLKFENIAFSAIDLYGTNIILRLVDYEKKEENYHDDNNIIMSDIVAEKDAVVKKIIVSKGTQVATENMFVKKGDILISGRVKDFRDIENNLEKYERAKGKVIGKIAYDITTQKRLKREIKYYTGNKHYEFILTNGKKVFEYKNKYEKVDVKQNEFKINDKKIVLNVYSEYITKYEDIDIESAKSDILREINDKILKDTKRVYDIQTLNEKYFILEDVLYLNQRIMVTEEIGKEVIK